MTPIVAQEYLYPEELYSLRSRVLIILNSGWNDLSEEDQMLLKKILGSVKLDLAAVQIITFREFDLNELKVYSPQQVITFGAVLKTPQPQYQLISLQEVSLIQADSLGKLDDSKKKSLWTALKQMFNI